MCLSTRLSEIRRSDLSDSPGINIQSSLCLNILIVICRFVGFLYVISDAAFGIDLARLNKHADRFLLSLGGESHIAKCGF